jgi:hypothetical protein
MRERQAAHPIHSFRGRSAPANIPILVRWIRAHHKKVGTRLQLAMAGTRKKQCNISGAHVDFTSLFTAQDQLGLASRKPENLMGR